MNSKITGLLDSNSTIIEIGNIVEVDFKDGFEDCMSGVWRGIVGFKDLQCVVFFDRYYKGFYKSLGHLLRDYSVRVVFDKKSELIFLQARTFACDLLSEFQDILNRMEKDFAKLFMEIEDEEVRKKLSEMVRKDE